MDRRIRFGLGAGALGLALLRPMQRRARIATLMFGASELLTATARYCPVSQLLGVNTCKTQLLQRKRRRIAKVARRFRKALWGHLKNV
jgi:hypothetical protein